MARFTAIPAVPQGGITDWQSVLISSVKENVELLTGLRGESDLISKAITQGQITVNLMPDQDLKQVTAKGAGFTISCLLYTSPSPRDAHESRMPSSA